MKNPTIISKLTPEGKLVGDYLLLQIVHDSVASQIWKAVHIKTEKVFAVRKLEKYKIETNPILKKLLMSEVAIMKSINHPNILRLFDFFESHNNYYLVMDYCDTNLNHLLK